MRYLSIKNHRAHQHYKDRRPPWIKLHVAILDDYAFSCLQDASKAHLLLLGVLASKMDNRIPFDADFLARKLGATGPVDVEVLVSYGFVDVSEDDASTTLAPRKQMPIVETETETEKKLPVPRKAAAGDENFERTWRKLPKRSGTNSKPDAQKAWRARLAAGVDPAEMEAGAERYKAWADATGKSGTEKVMQGMRFFGVGEHWKESWAVPTAVAMTSGRTAVMNSAELSEYKRAELESINAHRLARGEAPLVNA